MDIQLSPIFYNQVRFPTLTSLNANHKHCSGVMGAWLASYCTLIRTIILQQQDLISSFIVVLLHNRHYSMATASSNMTCIM